MAMKALVFLFAYALLVTSRVSHFVDGIDDTHAHPLERHHVYPPTKAPAHPPQKPYHHHHTPEKAPFHQPHEKHHPHPHPHPPTYPPRKPYHHHHAPEKAPFHPPHEKHHPHPPAHPPRPHYAHPPRTAPMHPPIKFQTPTPLVAPQHGCVSKCEEYCKKDHLKKRPCVKDCTACCDKYKCVPEPKKTCSSWDHVNTDHGKLVKCP